MYTNLPHFYYFDADCTFAFVIDKTITATFFFCCQYLCANTFIATKTTMANSKTASFNTATKATI